MQAVRGRERQADLVPVRGQQHRLVGNLVDNAVRFAGEAEVRLSRSPTAFG